MAENHAIELRDCIGRIHRICAKVLAPDSAYADAVTAHGLAELISTETAKYASPLALASDVDVLQELYRRGYGAPDIDMPRNPSWYDAMRATGVRRRDDRPHAFAGPMES